MSERLGAVGHLRLIIPAKKLIPARARRAECRLSRCRMRRSCPPGRSSGPPFVGVIERSDFRVAEQPGGLLD